MIYDKWETSYEDSVSKECKITWKNGVLKELKALDIKRGHIVDAGAGTGTGARYLRELGDFHITSIDRSEQMLRHAKEVSDEVILADLTTLPTLSHPVDLIVSGFDSLNYLSKRGLGNFMSWCAKTLCKKGKLIFDYSSPKLLREDWKHKEYFQKRPEGALKWKHVYIEALGICETTITQFDKNGVQIWSEEHQQFSFDTYEMYQITSYAKLKIIKCRSLTKDHFSPESKTHVYVIEA